MTVREFCKKYSACPEGREWALATGQTMDEIWARDDLRPEWRVWIATRPGVLDDRTLRIFACWCVRQIWHLLYDARSRNAVEVSERYANGKATAEELAAAMNAAMASARAAACDAAWAAARDAAWAAARDAAMNAAMNAARAAACDDAWAAARDAQAQWLRENAHPDFSGGGHEA